MLTVRFGENTADDFNSVTQDAGPAAAAPDTNYSTVNENRAGIKSGTNNRAVIRFNIKSILDGLGVTEITLGGLNLYNHLEESTVDESVSLYRLLLNWVVSEVTWNSWKSGSAWNTGGFDSASDITGEDSTADRRATAEDSVTITGIGTYFTWTMTTAAEAWRSGTWSEYGVGIVNDDEINANTCKRFSSADYTDGERPYLEVTCTVATVVPPKIHHYKQAGGL